MSDEEKKNNKKAFIKWLISSLFLTGGAASGIAAVSETEKIEENEGEENTNKPIGSKQKVPNTKPVDNIQNLSSLLTTWNPVIVTNGETFNNQQKIDELKNQLATGIDKQQVEITISGTTVTIKPIHTLLDTNYIDKWTN